MRATQDRVKAILPRVEYLIVDEQQQVRDRLERMLANIEDVHEQAVYRLSAVGRVLAELDPNRVLARGYAIMRGDATVGSEIEIEQRDKLITAEVRHVRQK